MTRTETEMKDCSAYRTAFCNWEVLGFLEPPRCAVLKGGSYICGRLNTGPLTRVLSTRIAC